MDEGLGALFQLEQAKVTLVSLVLIPTIARRAGGAGSMRLRNGLSYGPVRDF